MVRYYGNGVDLRALLTRIRPIGIKWSAKSSRYEKPDDSTDVNGFEEALMFLNFCFVPFIWFFFVARSQRCVSQLLFLEIFSPEISNRWNVQIEKETLGNADRFQIDLLRVAGL